MKHRVLQLDVNALIGVLTSVIKERAGTPPFLVAFVVHYKYIIYEYITTVDHKGQKRVSMGFLLGGR